VARLFGTDGVRGLANRDLTAELTLDLSVAAAHVLADLGAFEGHRPVAVVGRDGRASGEFLAAAAAAGLASAGVDVLDVGVLPTPAVAYLTESTGADLGVMLSASHNPMPDNGLKFFARGGVKLDDVLEEAVETRMREPWDRPTGAAVGRIRPFTEGIEDYLEHLRASAPASLAGLTVALDCANGAASLVGPEALRRSGASVISIAAEPDGWNINDGCGSTHLGPLQRAVVEHGADLGLALDGDADRLLAVAADGSVVDGDQLLAILALALRTSGRLTHDTVVSTVMANHGFRLAMDRESIKVVETAVGDRYVLEAMRDGGYVLGGEQSGHLLLLDRASTGDGLLAALTLLGHVAATARSLGDLADVVQRLPQVLINVGGVDKDRVESAPRLVSAVAAAEAELGGRGRVLLRPSGTEALVRVMVEADSEATAAAVAERLADVVREELALD
jgi:phosphoglucosamine mutase